jgi:hypothetical protein
MTMSGKNSAIHSLIGLTALSDLLQNSFSAKKNQEAINPTYKIAYTMLA